MNAADDFYFDFEIEVMSLAALFKESRLQELLGRGGVVGSASDS